jgi:hypothetical protein
MSYQFSVAGYIFREVGDNYEHATDDGHKVIAIKYRRSWRAVLERPGRPALQIGGLCRMKETAAAQALREYIRIKP